MLIPDSCITDKMSIGAWGYLLSWEKILNKARCDGHKRILCLDDDVVFHRDFTYQFHNLSRWIPDDWKIFNLGASQHITIDLPDSGPNRSWYHPSTTDGSFATGISSSIFLELLNEIRHIKSCLSSPKPQNDIKQLLPLDSGPLREMYRRYPNDCYVAYPNLIISDVRNSSIRGPRDQTRIAKKFGWDLSKYNWPPREDLVSIIIACYNAERTITQSVLSARLQDYPNCEVIVVDDCSTDNTAELLKEALHSMDCTIGGVSRRLHPMKLLRNTENAGCYATRNRGIMASRGRWITFQDADDISVQERITVQLSALMRYDVLFTTSLILRSHLPDFSTIKQYDQASVMNTLAPTRIHKHAHYPTTKDHGGVDHGSVDDNKNNKRIRTLTGRSNHNNNNNYKYCCRGILGMVTTLFSREIFYDMGLYWTLPCTADAEFCERLLYHKAGKAFSKDESVVTYLSQNTHIPGIYYRVNKILYISEEMRPENLTSQIKGNRDLKEEYVRNWRTKLVDKYNYDYPRMK